jgi:hypothetical protein
MSARELAWFLGDIQWDTANYCGGVAQNQTYPFPENGPVDWVVWLFEEDNDGKIGRH